MSGPVMPAIEVQHKHLSEVAETLYNLGTIEHWHVANIDHDHIDISSGGESDSILAATRMTITASNAGTKGIQSFEAVCRDGHCHVTHIDCGEG